MNIKIKKMNPLSLARFQAILFACLGLLAGIFYSFGGFILDVLVSLKWIESSQTSGLSLGTLLAFAALIGMPLIFGITGFALGLVESLIFNCISPLIGGIDIDSSFFSKEEE